MRSMEYEEPASSSSQQRITRDEFIAEIKAHCSIAWPVCMSFLLRKSTDIVSVISVGHLGSQYLAAVGVASVTANVTGNSMIWGMAGALSTICSQAYGLQDSKTLTITLQRSILILLSCLCVPVSLLWIFSTKIMLALGQSDEVAQMANAYLLFLLPSLWTLACSACIQNWLHSMSNTRAVATITLITATLHPLWCYLFIYYFKLGYLGAAISINIKESFTNWWSFLRLGLPNLLMMSEWWASEAVIFMSGSLPDPSDQLSAMSIYQSLISLSFMLPMGFSTSGNTRVGNALGANKPHMASLASKVAPFLTLLLCVLMVTFVAVFHSYMAQAFTSDKNVLKLVRTTIPPLLIYIVADGLQCALTGVIKGLGKQRIGGPIVLFSYYVIGIPAAILLAFKHGANLGLVGLCFGTMIGTCFHFILYFIVVFRTNWTKETEYIQMKQLLTSLPKSNQSTSPRNNNHDTKEDEPDDDVGDWWEAIDFLGTGSSSETADPKATRRPVIQTFRDALVVVYNRIARRFGWEEMLYEYEMVKNYADSILDDVIVL